MAKTRVVNFSDFFSLSAVSDSNIIRAMKSRSMGWVGSAACVGEMRTAHLILVGECERKREL
jgi:hypothetical protein